MAMTRSRRRVYNKGWYRRECKEDMRRRRKEYNRRIRHTKITEDSTSKEARLRGRLEWNTIS